MTEPQPRKVLASVSPVIGAGLTIAGWVVVANVAWQLVAGLTQAMLCEARSRGPLECLPAWSQLHEIGRRSTDTLLALVVHSPAESAAAALGGLAGGASVVGGVLYSRRQGHQGEEAPLGDPIGIVPTPVRDDDAPSDDTTPA